MNHEFRFTEEQPKYSAWEALEIQKQYAINRGKTSARNTDIVSTIFVSVILFNVLILLAIIILGDTWKEVKKLCSNKYIHVWLVRLPLWELCLVLVLLILTLLLMQP